MIYSFSYCFSQLEHITHYKKSKHTAEEAYTMRERERHTHTQPHHTHNHITPHTHFPHVHPPSPNSDSHHLCHYWKIISSHVPPPSPNSDSHHLCHYWKIISSHRHSVTCLSEHSFQSPIHVPVMSDAGWHDKQVVPHFSCSSSWSVLLFSSSSFRLSRDTFSTATWNHTTLSGWCTFFSIATWNCIDALSPQPPEVTP